MSVKEMTNPQFQKSSILLMTLS